MKRTVSALLFVAFVGLSGGLFLVKAADPAKPTFTDLTVSDGEGVTVDFGTVALPRNNEDTGDVADPEIANLRQRYLDIQRDLANGLTAEELRTKIESATAENRETWAKARLARIVKDLEAVKKDFAETPQARTAQAAIDVITNVPRDQFRSDRVDQ